VRVAGTDAAEWRAWGGALSKTKASWWRPALQDPPWAPGLCGPTDGEGDCNADDRGSWNTRKHRIGTMDDCVAKCRSCANCAFVSFSGSAAHQDCSWYSQCELRDLRRPPLSGLDYNTTRVRHAVSRVGSSSVVARPRPDEVPSGDAAQRVRLAISTIGVGSGSRCGFTRWCQSARRLRGAILRGGGGKWDVTLVVLALHKTLQRQQSYDGVHAGRSDEIGAAVDERDCPGVRRMPIPRRVLKTAERCMGLLDGAKLVPLRAASANPWPRVVNLAKWTFFGMDAYDLIFYVDLDADALPATEPSMPVGALWRKMVPQLLVSPHVRILATADSMASTHGGLFLLRPSKTVYAEGLSTLRRCVWNETHGFDHAGRPRSLRFAPQHLDGTPIAYRSADVGGNQHPLTTDGFRLNDWGFWYSMADQGLLWYELFVRARRGAYSRWSTPHKATHEWGGEEKPWQPARSGKPLRTLSVHKLAMRLRYLIRADLPYVAGNETAAAPASTAARPSPCAARLWRMRRAIEADPRFTAIWHRMAEMPLARFSVW